MLVNVLSAVPAAGKTAAILKKIHRTGEKAVIASISKTLSRQSFEYFQKLGGEGVLVDTEHRYGYQSVSEAIEGMVDEDVIFITHKALLCINDFEFLRGFNLYIDEVPDMVSFQQHKFSNMSVFEPYAEVKDGFLRVKRGGRTPLRKAADMGRKGKDVIHAALLPIYKTLLNDTPILVTKVKEETNLIYIHDDTTEKWSVFDSVTICAANVADTFTGKILQRVNGWEFTQSPLEKDLLFTQYPNSDRVTINVMYDKPWSKYSADYEIDGTTNYRKIMNKIESIIEPDFIYTKNKKRPGFDSGVEVDYNPHGLNNYMDYKSVVVLFCYNPIPWQVPFLKLLSKSLGMDEDELLNAYSVTKYLEPAFQLCARSDIRNKDSLEKINLYVPDMKLAQYMLRYFPDATITTEHMVKDQRERKQETKPRNHRSFQKQWGMTDKERYRYRYLLRKLGRKLSVDDVEDQELVRDWIIDQRMKHSI